MFGATYVHERHTTSSTLNVHASANNATCMHACIHKQNTRVTAPNETGNVRAHRSTRTELSPPGRGRPWNERCEENFDRSIERGGPTDGTQGEGQRVCVLSHRATLYIYIGETRTALNMYVCIIKGWKMMGAPRYIAAATAGATVKDARQRAVIVECSDGICVAQAAEAKSRLNR